MQTTSTNASGGGPTRLKRTVSSPGMSHHVQMRSWRPADSTMQSRQMRKALPAVLENEMDDFNVLQLPPSPTPTSPASVERTKKAMQATLALLRRSSSTPTKDGTNTGKENQISVPRQRKAVEASKEVAAAPANHNNLAAPRTPSKQLRRRSQKAAAAASPFTVVPTNTPSTPTPSKLKTPNPPSSAPSSGPTNISRLSINIPKRTPSSMTPLPANDSPRTIPRTSQPTPTSAPHPSIPTFPTSSPDPEPLRSSRNISANDMVHAYYTILRERDPAHYLLNLNDEEEEIISQSQYAALLKLACQKFKRGDGRDRVALAYAEGMLGPVDGEVDDGGVGS